MEPNRESAALMAEPPWQECLDAYAEAIEREENTQQVRDGRHLMARDTDYPTDSAS